MELLKDDSPFMKESREDFTPRSNISDLNLFAAAKFKRFTAFHDSSWARTYIDEVNYMFGKFNQVITLICDTQTGKYIYRWSGKED